MRIVISSGHGKYIRGAAGSPVPPYLDEVNEARLVVEQVAVALRSLGVEVTTFHDNTSHDQSTNLNTIVNFHNARGPHDLDVSVHFNAYEQTSTKPMGCEVLWVSSAGEKYARTVVDKICAASGLINRGPKKRTDLKFLNATNETAILIETAFCDSKPDAEIYHAHFGAICTAIAEGITGEVAIPGPEPEPPEPGPTPPPEERSTLSKGDTGDDVENLQASIAAFPADGDFGSKTDAQVRAFQRAAYLTPVDGVVGPDTWGEVDALDARGVAGSSGLPHGLGGEVLALAKASPLMTYSWPDRGRAPPGYIPGMALSYALALTWHNEEHSAAEVMAERAYPSTEAATDALAWYASEMQSLGLDVTAGGVETMRALFTLLIGLGMRESSGNYSCGRDQSAGESSQGSDTCEAGLFQGSWNLKSASPEMEKLLDYYWSDPNAFLDVFAEGISPTAANLETVGSGEGARYQWPAKFAPGFAVMMTAVGLRKRKDHWGPIKRKEVTLSGAAVALLHDVEALVEDALPVSTAAAAAEAAEVHIETKGNVRVFVNRRLLRR